LQLDVESDGVARFKWGWNAVTTETTVWPVAGPGDGFPGHDLHLSGAWGRPPRDSAGDVIGVAFWEPPRLSIEAYYGRPAPEGVIAWFRSEYPNATIRTS
jgi:hypothetical protein